MPHPQDIENTLHAKLGDDLTFLLQDLDSNLVSVEEITRLTSSGQTRGSFKLTLANGTRLKGRLHRSEESRLRASQLLPLLQGLGFPDILAARGRTTLESWVEGTILHAAEVTQNQARRAGALLGTLHSTDITPAIQGTSAGSTPEEQLEKTRRHLARLTASIPQHATLFEKLSSIAGEHKPASLAEGLVHTDFCAENMVVDANGKLVAIDNEGLRIGALDYDIARCWSRWPMSIGLRDAFSEGYQQFRSLSAFRAHELFWAIRAMSMTLSVHIRHGREQPVAIETLGRIAAGHSDDLWPGLAY